MSTIENLSASDILAIPLGKPHLLFPGDVNGASLLHKRLVAKWHPDRNNGVGSDVMGHINVLFERALDGIQAGTFAGSSVLKMEGRDGKGYTFRFQKMVPFELGRLYIASRSIVYVIGSRYTDLAKNAVSNIRSLGYHNDAMRQEHERYMPKVEKVLPLIGGDTALVIRKQADQVLLADVLSHFGGAIEPRHVAWIVSSLCNVNCYLKWARINHNDISPATYFISPTQHNGALLGGWWYSATTGNKPLAVPARTHGVGSDFTTKAIDGTLIRITGKELLGSEFAKAPMPMQMWLRGLGTKNSYDEYKAWSEMLTNAFGARRYAEMKLPDTL